MYTSTIRQCRTITMNFPLEVRDSEIGHQRSKLELSVPVGTTRNDEAMMTDGCVTQQMCYTTKWAAMPAPQNCVGEAMDLTHLQFCTRFQRMRVRAKK
jgi:hypothetical protein